MTNKQIAKRGSEEPVQKEEAVARRSETADTETIYVPNVDIREDRECVRLEAEMPGVDPESVDVTVENEVLTIAGQSRLAAPPGYELVGQEYGVGRYRRDFTLSDAVDAEGIKARMRNGLLEVTIPKREEVKTRKIKIEA